MQCASVRRTWRVAWTKLATSSPTLPRSPARSEVDPNYTDTQTLHNFALHNTSKRTSSTTQTIVPESNKACLFIYERATNAQRVVTDGHTRVQMGTRIHVAAQVLARIMRRLADVALQGCRFSRPGPRDHSRRSAKDTTAGHQACGRGR